MLHSDLKRVTAKERGSKRQTERERERGQDKREREREIESLPLFEFSLCPCIAKLIFITGFPMKRLKVCFTWQTEQHAHSKQQVGMTPELALTMGQESRMADISRCGVGGGDIVPLEGLMNECLAWASVVCAATRRWKVSDWRSSCAVVVHCSWRRLCAVVVHSSLRVQLEFRTMDVRACDSFSKNTKSSSTMDLYFICIYFFFLQHH